MLHTNQNHRCYRKYFPFYKEGKKGSYKWTEKDLVAPHHSHK